MCGIFSIFASTKDPAALRQQALLCSKKLRHRGPDWSGIVVESTTGETPVSNAVSHERLAIMDPESGEQPLVSVDGKYTLAVNGEVYNYKELKTQLREPYAFKTGSDCEVIIPLFQQFGLSFLNKLRGMYAFVLVHNETGEFIAVRDHMGICPLYMGWGADGSLVFASEMKALCDICVRFRTFPPGHVYQSEADEPLSRWYNPAWLADGHLGTTPLDLDKVRKGFEAAVHRRMMTDVPWGVLLSGGLDSSLVAAIACRHFKTLGPASERATVFPAVHSFTIGLKDSADIAAAQKVADFLGTVHHAYEFTVQQGLDAVADIIYHLETYDVTTIRAATPMFLMSRKIKSLGIKMVLSGEGADEALGGYLYFHKAPSPEAFHKETVDKLDALHMFDCLRANKATSAWGLEARVPFLDADFLDLVMECDTRQKMITDRKEGRIEKWLIRKAFDTEDNPYLPKEVLWRQKEQFSDGVGYSWIDGLKDYAASHVSDAQMRQACHLFPHNTPTTKEAYYYRSVFESHFPQQSAVETVPGGPSIACSTAKAVEWDKAFAAMADCSGRSVTGVHEKAYEAGSADVAHLQAPPSKRPRTS
eukprot:g2443.t1